MLQLDCAARYDGVLGKSTTAITYLGHSSAVIEVNGLTLYTDPHFGPKALWPKRQRPVPIAPSDLPNPDAILISHAHYDHLDLQSFKYFSADVPVFVPRGLALFLGRFIRNPIIELVVGATFQLKEQTIRATLAIHRGGRLTMLRYHQCIGYLIGDEEGQVFFAGDTGYTPELLELRQFGPITVALLPIGPIYPKWFMKPRHLDPDQALQLAAELDVGAMIPIHWGVFRLGFEAVDTPLNWLKARLESSSIRDRVVILELGETWHAPQA